MPGCRYKGYLWQWAAAHSYFFMFLFFSFLTLNRPVMCSVISFSNMNQFLFLISNIWNFAELLIMLSLLVNSVHHSMTACYLTILSSGKESSGPIHQIFFPMTVKLKKGRVTVIIWLSVKINAAQSCNIRHLVKTPDKTCMHEFFYENLWYMISMAIGSGLVMSYGDMELSQHWLR